MATTHPLNQHALAGFGEGEILSPSQAKTFLTCAAKWYFRYVIGIREPKSGSLALGSAFHKAITSSFQRKLAGAGDLSFGQVLDIYNR